MELYHEDAEWFRFEGVVKGRDEIRKVLELYWDRELDFVSMEEYIHSEDAVLSRATLRVKGEEVVVFGIAVYRDGKIWRQAGGDEGGSRDWS